MTKLIKYRNLNIDFIDFDLVDFIDNQTDNFNKIIVNINYCKHNLNNETDNLNYLKAVDNY